MPHTRESCISDLFCTNKPGLAKSVNVIPGLSDHELVCADCNIRAQITKKHLVRYICGPRRTDNPYAQSYVNSGMILLVLIIYVQWRKFFSKFKSEVESLVSKYIPFKMTSTRFNMPWFNNTAKRMCKKKTKIVQQSLTDQA